MPKIDRKTDSISTLEVSLRTLTRLSASVLLYSSVNCQFLAVAQVLITF